MVIKPRRGTFVKKITRCDIDDHYPVQASLEGLAARQAAGRIGRAECRELSAQLEAMEKAAAGGDTKAFLKHHEAFHMVYIDGSRNQLLVDMIMKLRLRGIRFRYFFPHTPEYCRQSLAIHHRIKDELCAPEPDPALVENLVRNHIEEMITMDGWEL